MVIKDLPTPGITLNYTDGTDDAYDTGFDRFGRVAAHLWYDSGGSADVFKIEYGYDRASNRTFAERNQYAGYSQYYTYDDLHRLKNFKTGQPTYTSGTMTGVASHWTRREKEWTFDAQGNHTAMKDFGKSNWIVAEYNAANEHDDDADDREVHTDGPSRVIDEEFSTDTSANWTKPGSGDAFDVNSTNSGYLTFTTVAQDMIDSQQEGEARAFVITGEDIGLVPMRLRFSFPSGISTGYIGMIFGYKSANDYWMYVGDLAADKNRLYHVVDGSKDSVLAEAVRGYSAGSSYSLYTRSAKRGSLEANGVHHTFTDGWPSGKVGLVTNVTNAMCNQIYADDYAQASDMGGRWAGHSSGSYFHGTDRLALGTWNYRYIGVSPQNTK